METNKNVIRLFNAIRGFNEMVDLEEQKFIKGEVAERVVLKTQLIYGLDKNMKNVTRIVEELRKKDILADKQKYLSECSTKERALLKEYADKDEKGEVAVSEKGECCVPEDKLEEFNAKIKELSDEYNPIITELDKTWETILAEEVDIEFYKIKEELLPEIIVKSDYLVFKELIIDEVID